VSHLLAAAAAVLAARTVYSANPNSLAYAGGGLLGMALAFWVLYSSHLMRVLVWVVALLVAGSRAAIGFASPGLTGEDKFLLGVATALGFAFLLILGWLGRTPERSQKIFLVVAGVKVVLVLFALGVLAFSKI
jgi:hypothetical protein